MHFRLLFFRAALIFSLALQPACSIFAPELMDENRILFIQIADKYNDLFTMNPDGTDVQRLTRDDLSYVNAVCSPDLQRIAAAGIPVDRRDATEIHILGRTGNHLYRLVSGGWRPVWSPDGARIAFEKHGLGISLGIAIINADGTNERELDREPNTVVHVWDWSRDGLRLLVTIERYVEGSSLPESYELYEMDLNGNLTRQITDTDEIMEYDAIWTDDNGRIAYSTIGLYRDIYIVDPDSAGEEPVTLFGNQKISSFRWSPDGRQIAFTWYEQSGNGDERREWANIYTINDDGTGLTQITFADSTASIINIVADWR